MAPVCSYEVSIHLGMALSTMHYVQCSTLAVHLQHVSSMSGYSECLLSTMYNAAHKQHGSITFAASLHNYSTLYLVACMQCDPSTYTACSTLYPWWFFWSQMASNSGNSVDAQLSILRQDYLNIQAAIDTEVSKINSITPACIWQAILENVLNFKRELFNVETKIQNLKWQK